MSSHNILQLMTHLNDFEITINNVICDFTSRLSALIDANFFLILENRDGRKLCGSPALVDDYVRGMLSTRDSDQIADFDAKPPISNRFVRLSTVAAATTMTNGNVDNVAVDGFGSSGVSNDRLSSSAFNALDLSCEIEETGLVEVEEEEEKPRQRNNKRRSAENGGNRKHGEDGRTPKKSRMTYDQFGNIEDDICIVEDEGDPDYQLEDEADSYGTAPPHLPPEDASSTTTSSRARGRSMESVIAMDPLLTVEAYEVDVSSLKLPFNKIQVLQSLEDPAAIFQKDSVEFKLASSILYDFGKELAHVCPYAGDGIKAKVFFHQNFKSFLSIFPCLKSDLIQNIRIAKKSAEAHMKNNARAGFNSVFDKKKKDVSYVE